MPAIGSNLRQLASFVVIGVLATAAHYTVLVLLVQLAHKPPVPATLLGYCLGGIISYLLNRRHTFKSGKRHREAVWRFVAVAGVGFLATALMMTLAVDWRHLPYLPAQIVVTGIVTIWSYAASRWWTFAERAAAIGGGPDTVARHADTSASPATGSMAPHGEACLQSLSRRLTAGPSL